MIDTGAAGTDWQLSLHATCRVTYTYGSRNISCSSSPTAHEPRYTAHRTYACSRDTGDCESLRGRFYTRETRHEVSVPDSCRPCRTPSLWSHPAQRALTSHDRCRRLRSPDLDLRSVLTPAANNVIYTSKHWIDHRHNHSHSPLYVPQTTNRKLFSITGTFCGKFVIPAHFNCVATLPCEI